MKSYEIGLYEKAVRDSLSWKDKLLCAKECGYDYIEISIDASEKRINRIYMDNEERLAFVQLMYETGLPIRSMSVSALTKYALGDPDRKKRERGMEILEGCIKLAADIGIRTVMIPGYDIYYGKSTYETKQLFLKNLKRATVFAEKEGVLLGFETMENEFMNTVEKAMKYVTLVDSAYLKVYPDAGNITNAGKLYQHDICEDMYLGKGNLIALHLKETVPGVFREVPFFKGHVDFEAIIHAAWKMGVRRYVTELWDTGQETWKEDICYANQRMRAILDRQEVVQERENI